jgi:hypothetical protein
MNECPRSHLPQKGLIWHTDSCDLIQIAQTLVYLTALSQPNVAFAGGANGFSRSIIKRFADFNTF